MANLYRKPIVVNDPKTGRKVKTHARKWWGRYRNEHGVDRRVPLATDKSAAQAMLHQLVIKADRRAAGMEDPFEKHHKRSLVEHLADFRNYLTNKGSNAAYVRATEHQVRSVISACKFERISQISASRVQEFLAELRDRGHSISSSNHYLRSIKMFTRWLVRDHRTVEDRLLHLSKMNPDLDRRRVRRPLSMEEFGLLLKVAESGEPIQHVPGPDRAIVYIVGAYTGYRRNEIGSVTSRSFNFDSDPPTLTVEAGYSKHRRTDVLPLRRDFAERIRTWIEGKRKVRPDEPLFRISGKRTAEMLKKDLAATRAKWMNAASDPRERAERERSSFLAYEDDRGRVADFHAPRMTFITNLSRSGVSPKTAQTLARHSDINLTMNTYTLLGVMDQAAAVESLPPIPSGSHGREEQRQRPTGTTGQMAMENRSSVVPTVVPRGANNGAIRLASSAYDSASDCTEERVGRTQLKDTATRENPKETGRILTDPASDCIDMHRGLREGGVEPPHLAVQDPKSCASASSATLACERTVRSHRIVIDQPQNRA